MFLLGAVLIHRVASRALRGPDGYENQTGRRGRLFSRRLGKVIFFAKEQGGPVIPHGFSLVGLDLRLTARAPSIPSRMLRIGRPSAMPAPTAASRCSNNAGSRGRGLASPNSNMGKI